jgi:hypothetical protein
VFRQSKYPLAETAMHLDQYALPTSLETPDYTG